MKLHRPGFIDHEITGGLVATDLVKGNKVISTGGFYSTSYGEVTYSRQRHITVAKSGGDFTTIQGALDSIIDASSTNKYVIEVFPGVYTEDLTGKAWVSIKGQVPDIAGPVQIASTTGSVLTTANDGDQTYTDLHFRYTGSGNGDRAVDAPNDGKTYNLIFEGCTFSCNITDIAMYLLVIDGYYAQVNNCRFEYVQNDVGGTAPASVNYCLNTSNGDTQVNNCYFDMDVANDDNDRLIAVSHAAAGGDNPLLISNCFFRLTVSGANWAGLILALNSIGSGTPTSDRFTNNTIIVENTGGGLGTAYAMAIQSNAETLNSHANHFDIINFATKFAFFSLFAGDTINSTFDDMKALTSSQIHSGPATLNQILGLQGELNVSEKINMNSSRITNLGTPTIGTDAARLVDVYGPGFYGTTVKLHDDSASFPNIEVHSFHSDNFYIHQNSAWSDEVQINLKVDLSTIKQIESLRVLIEEPVIKNYTLDEFAQYRYDVEEVYAKTDIGSLSGAFYIIQRDGVGRGTVIDGLDRPDCDFDTEQKAFAATGNNEVPPGGRLLFSVPESLSAADLAMTIKLKRYDD